MPSEVQNTQVRETKVFKQQYYRSYESQDDFPDVISYPVLCYSGQATHPRWIDKEGECDHLEFDLFLVLTSHQVAILHCAPFQRSGVC